MRLTLFRSLAASLALAVAAAAATRPHYGDVLRMEAAGTLKSLDPLLAVSAGEGSATHVRSLLFETLIRLDQHAMPQPQLAISWQHDDAMRHWEFRLRPGVKFADGVPLTAADAAESLKLSLANACAPRPAGSDVVVVECKDASPEVWTTVSLPRQAIVRRTANTMAGTGPFKIKSWDSKRIVLGRNEHRLALCFRKRLPAQPADQVAAVSRDEVVDPLR